MSKIKMLSLLPRKRWWAELYISFLTYSLDPTTNSKSTNSNFQISLYQLVQVLLTSLGWLPICYCIFREKQSDWWRNLWKFGICSFRVECWIRWWARYLPWNRTSNIRPLTASADTALDLDTLKWLQDISTPSFNLDFVVKVHSLKVHGWQVWDKSLYFIVE